MSDENTRDLQYTKNAFGMLVPLPEFVGPMPAYKCRCMECRNSLAGTLQMCSKQDNGKEEVRRWTAAL